MDKDELGEWSRHFDSLLWNVTTIFAAGIGGLMVYAYSNFDIVISIVGLLITPIPVYFASSFREVRRNIDRHLDQEVKEAMYEPRRLHQWPIYVLLFVAIEVLWVWLLIKNYPNLLCVWIVLGLGVVAITLWGAYLGKVAWTGQGVK